jgi:lipoate-protein ligase A
MAMQLLVGTSLSGPWQMALDAALLEQRQAVLRLYSWSRPTLSLGFHQACEPHWLDPPGSRIAVYQQVCSWLQQAFAALGEPLQFGHERARAGGDCFASSTAADLLNSAGHKRIGSAMRWQRGCLLQHGSIQLRPDPQHWQLLLGRAAPQLAPLGLGAEQLEQHLIEQARRWFQLPAQGQPLTAELLSLAGAALEDHRCSG